MSYDRRDDALARKIARRLQETGLEVWDDRNILPGQNWAGEIAAALEGSEAMVVLLSTQGLASNYVRQEVEYALGKEAYKKRVIPVVVGELPEEEVPWILRHFQMIRLAGPATEEAGIQRIADVLHTAS